MPFSTRTTRNSGDASPSSGYGKTNRSAPRCVALQARRPREDFQPDLSAKTIARIEQGRVKRIHSKTLGVLADKLAVTPEEIATY